MKNKLILLYLFFLTSNLFSQYNFDNYEIGYYFDVNHQIIDGYYDENYQPKNPLKLSYTTGDYFTPGYYYDLNNKKISGLIRYVQRNTFFKFKSDRKADQQTITPYDCVGYVIGLDSFAVIEDFSVEREIGGFQSSEKEFAEVIDQVDNLTFYKHTRVGSDNIVYTYLVKDGNAGNYTSFPKGINKFKKISVQIFGEFESLKTQILSEKYDASDIPTMVKLLKYKRKYDKKEKIHYTSSWDETEDTHKSAYYASIESLKDSVFHLKFYFNNGVPIYEGDIYSFCPRKRTGDFIWYYPSGTIRKKINYLNNKPQETTTYFRNGNIHYIYKTENKACSYSAVFNLNGEKILDNSGCGTEVFYDSIANRKITYKFSHYKLISAYFLDSNNRRVYQLCKKNARLQPMQERMEEQVEYPYKSLLNFNHGFVLLKCIVEPSGLTSEMRILKSLDAECDSSIMNFLSFIKTKKNWIVAKVEKEKVPQELIIPVHFSIEGFSRSGNNSNAYSAFWMQQQMMTPQIPAFVH
jgi:hypothetical protein